jgi:predicted MFS family arabinose efflux permease
LSLVFSLGQLIGGLLVGLFLIKKLKKFWTFTLGCCIWIVYHFLSIYISNPYGFLVLHAINGFAYGMVYNLILGFVLQKAFISKKISPMGIYQSVMSVGIMCSSFFTSWLKTSALNQKDYSSYFDISKTINFVIIGAIALSWLIFAYTHYLEKWRFERLWFSRKQNKKTSV